MYLYDKLPKNEKEKVDEIKRKISKGEWVSNSDAQRVHDSNKTLDQVTREFYENGFQ